MGMSFFISTIGLSDCPVSLMSTSCCDISVVAVHTPQDEDLIYQRALLDIVIEQFENIKYIKNINYGEVKKGGIGFDFIPRQEDILPVKPVEILRQDLRELISRGHENQEKEEFINKLEYNDVDDMSLHELESAIVNWVSLPVNFTDIGNDMDDSRPNTANYPPTTPSMNSSRQNQRKKTDISPDTEINDELDKSIGELSLTDSIETGPLININNNSSKSEKTNSKNKSKTNLITNSRPNSSKMDNKSRSNSRTNSGHSSAKIDLIIDHNLTNTRVISPPNKEPDENMIAVLEKLHEKQKIQDEVQAELSSVHSILSIDKPIKNKDIFDDGLEDDFDDRLQVGSFGPQKPLSFFFIPANYINSFDNCKNKELTASPELFRLISPPSLMMITLPPIESKKSSIDGGSISSIMQLFSRNGFVSTQGDTATLVKSGLEFKLCSIAFRTSMIALVTTLKESFFFNLSVNEDTGQYMKPILVELNVRPQAAVTTIISADVCLKIAPDPIISKDKRVSASNGNKNKVAIPIVGSNIKETHILGTMMICFFGDSDGKIHYALSTKCGLVLQTGNFKAHSSAIASILVTGDPVKPLWRIGTVSGDDLNDQYTPIAVPGSAILSIARNGEVKVWQPVFTLDLNARSKKEQVLNIFKLKWKVSGMFTASTIDRIMNSNINSANNSTYGVDTPELSTIFAGGGDGLGGRVVNDVTKASLDPSCLSVIISFVDGRVEQWSIPGLVYADDGGLAVCRDSMWKIRKHVSAIQDIRLCVHLKDTIIGEVDPLQDGQAIRVGKTGKIINVVTYAALLKGPQKLTVGYTMDRLKLLASSSSLTTSSIDRSILMWKFQLSSYVSNPHGYGNQTAASCCLQLQPCRRFTFSNSPSAGLCYCITNNTNPILSIWRVSAVVNGVIVTASEGTRNELFKVTEDVIDEESLIRNKRAASPGFFRDAHLTGLNYANPSTYDLSSFREDIYISDGLNLMPVICEVKKAGRTVDSMTLRLPTTTGLSWNVFNTWSEPLTEPLPYSDKPVIYDNMTLDNIRRPKSAGIVASNVIVDNPDITKETLDSFDHGQDGRKKVDYNGMRLTMDLAAMKETMTSLKESPTRRFVVDKIPSPQKEGLDNDNDDSSIEDFDYNYVFESGFRKESVDSDVLKDKIETLTDSLNTFEHNVINQPSVCNDPNLNSRSTSVIHAFIPRTQEVVDMAPLGAHEGPEIKPLSRHTSPLRITRTEQGENSQENSLSLLSVHSDYKRFGSADDDGLSSLADSVSLDPVDKEPPAYLANNLLMLPIGKITKSQKLREEKSKEELQRFLQNSAKIKKTTYVSKSHLEKQLDDEDKKTGTKQSFANPVLFTPPPNFCDENMESARNRVIIDKPTMKKQQTNAKDIIIKAFNKAKAKWKHDLVKGVDRHAKFLNNAAKIKAAKESKAKAKAEKLKAEAEAAKKLKDDVIMDDSIVVEEYIKTSVPTPELATGANLVGVLGELKDGSTGGMNTAKPTDFKQIDNFFDPNAKGEIIYRTPLQDYSKVDYKSRAGRNPGKDDVNDDDDDNYVAPIIDLSYTADDMMSFFHANCSESQILSHLSNEQIEDMKNMLNELSINEHKIMNAINSETNVLVKVFESFATLADEHIKSETNSRSSSAIVPGSRRNSSAPKSGSLSKQTKIVDDKSVVSVAGDSVIEEAEEEDSDDEEEVGLGRPGTAGNILRTTTLNTMAIGKMKEKDILKFLMKPSEAGVSEVFCRISSFSYSEFSYDLYSYTDGEITIIILIDDGKPIIPFDISLFKTKSEFGTILTERYGTQLFHTEKFNIEKEIPLNKKFNVKSEKNYKVYSFIHQKPDFTAKVAPMFMSQESFNSTKFEFSSPSEILDIEWNRLSDEMKMEEIKAACRRLKVQKLYNNLTIDDLIPKFPTDIEINNKNKSTTKSEIKSQKKYLEFEKWWIGKDTESGYSSHRIEFLFSEIVFASKTPSILESYYLEGYPTDKEYHSLVILLEKIPLTASDDIKGPLDCDLFHNFRSWYKAGQVVLFGNPTPREFLPTISKPSNECVDDDDLSDNSVVSIVYEGDEKTPDSDNFSGSSTSSGKKSTEQFVEKRLQNRTDFLTSRSGIVDDCIAMVEKHIESYKQRDNRNLCFADLSTRRAKLGGVELDIIMGSEKLIELYKIRRLIKSKEKLSVDLTIIGNKVSTLQILSGADIFGTMLAELLVADEPPPITILCYPGTKRRPLKAWNTMSESEKTLELCIACSLDQIFELAIDSDIAVPDPEDSSLNGKHFPARKAKWNKFALWYAGLEFKCKLGLQCLPTLARCIFAEVWEGQTVNTDDFVYNTMKSLQINIPDAISTEFEAKLTEDDSQMNDDMHSLQSMQSISSAGSLESTRSLLIEENKSPFFMFYQKIVSSVLGMKLRFKMLQNTIDSVMSSRRNSMLRFLIPPGPSRVGHTFMFPKLGMLLPNLEMPPIRYKLWPQESNEVYSVSEILDWYTSDELDEEDRLMVNAEALAVKQRAFLEWLSHEPERIIWSQEMMLMSDKEGLIGREHYKIVETELKIEVEANEFIFEETIPMVSDDLEFLNDDTPYFNHGSGINNEDELADVQEATNAALQKAIEDEKKAKLKLQEDRRLKELEDQSRIKREEVDRRLAEGVNQRQQLREHLADLKEQKKQKIIDDKNREISIKNQIGVDILKKKEFEQEILRVQKLELMVIYERECMIAEEISQRDYYSMYKEVQLMENEDVLSFMSVQYEIKNEQLLEDRKSYLEIVYTPFEPFEFKKDKDKLAMIPTVLNTNDTDFDLIVDDNYDNYMEDDNILIDLNKPFNDADWNLEYFGKDGCGPYKTNEKIEKFHIRDNNAPAFEPLKIIPFFPKNKWPNIKSPISTPTIGLPKSYGEFTLLNGENEMTRSQSQPVLTKSISSHSNWQLFSDTTSGIFGFGPQLSRSQSAVNNKDNNTGKRKNIRLKSGSNDLINSKLHPVLPSILSNNEEIKSEMLTIDGGIYNNNASNSNDNMDDIDINNSECDDGLGLIQEKFLKYESKTQNIESNKVEFNDLDKMKSLLSSSADAISVSIQNDRIFNYETQRKLALASLTTLGKASCVGEVKLRKKVKKYVQGRKDDLNPLTIPIIGGKQRRDMMDKIHKADSIVQIIKEERDNFNDYVNSKAMVEDNFYLQACKPGIRNIASLGQSNIVRNYSEKIHKDISKQENDLLLGSGQNSPIKTLNNSPITNNIIRIIKKPYLGLPLPVTTLKQKKSMIQVETAKPYGYIKPMSLMGKNVDIKECNPNLVDKKLKRKVFVTNKSQLDIEETRKICLKLHEPIVNHLMNDSFVSGNNDVVVNMKDDIIRDNDSIGCGNTKISAELEELSLSSFKTMKTI
jgi:hypothetical protein